MLPFFFNVTIGIDSVHSGIDNNLQQLQASIDVLHGEAKGLFDTINQNHETWERACAGEAYAAYKRCGWSQEMDHLDALLEQIVPCDRIWVE